MSADRLPVFRCGACNKGFVWKAASAGKVRVCECGEFVPVPKTAPATVARAGAGDPGGTRFVDTASGQTVTSIAGSMRSSASMNVPTATDTLSGWELSTSEAPPLSALNKAAPDGRAAGAAPGRNGSAETPKTGDETVYDVKQAARKPRSRDASLDVSLDHANHELKPNADGSLPRAFLADEQRRMVREKFAAGTPLREWIAPCVALLIGSILCSLEIQMHLASTEARSQHIGRLVAAYLLINVVGVAAGALLVFFLANVRFGRPLNAVLKFLGIAVLTPAIWAGVLELVVQKNMAGDTSVEAGMIAGWVVELALIYSLISGLFDLEQFDAFWTVSGISLTKIVLFVVLYVVRSFLIA